MSNNNHLTKEEILRVAHLARLSLTKDEVADYQKRLGRVLEYVKELSEVKTNSDSFVRHIPKDAVAQRADGAVEFEDVALILENAPSHSDRHFLLPPVKDSN